MKNKILSALFVIGIMLTISFIGMGKAEAAWPKTLTVYESGSGNSIEYFNVKQSGYGAAFCMQRGLEGPSRSGYNVTLKQVVTTGPRAYIINSSASRSVKAKALWIYNRSVNSTYTQGWGSSKSEYSAAKALADKAKKAGASYTPVPTIKSVTTPTMTKSGDYYTSQKLTVAVNNVPSWSVSFSGAPSGTTVINKTATTFQIRVPVNNVTKTTSFTVKITGAKKTYYSAAWYTRTKKQDMLVTKATTVAPTKSVTAKVTYKTCHKVGSAYYGPTGKKISEYAYINSSCVKVCAKDSVTGKYVDKNKKAHTSETTEYLQLCYACSATKHNGYYIGKNGIKYQKIEDAAKTGCAQPCQTTKDKIYGYFWDKKYNKYTSNTNADFLKSCSNCNLKYNGNYYIDGIKVTQEERDKKCNGTCVVKDGKYYDENGKEVPTRKEMNKSCFDCNNKKKPGDILVDNDGNEVPIDITQEQWNERCKPQPVKHSCEFVDGKYYDKNNKQVGIEEYYDSCFDPTPIPDPTKAVDTELIRYEEDYHYTIKQEVPHRTTNNYYKSYVFTDVLEEPLQVKSEDDVKITQIDKATGKKSDWTNKFTIKIDGQKVTATLKNPSDKEFYGTRDANNIEHVKEYSYVLTASLKDNAETKYDMKKYQVGDYYRIPDTANISIVDNSGQTISRDTNKVEVEYRPNPVPAKSVSGVDQTSSYENGTSYAYIINYQVYDYKGNQRYKSFELRDTFADPVEINSAKNVTIKNDANQDVTTWFNISVKGQTLTAKLKDEYNNDDFYGKTYSFNINVKLKQGYNLKKYLQGNQYVIPNEASVILDGNKTTKTNKVDVTVALKAVPKVIIPNTASPLQVAGIAAGIAILISGAAAILQKYKLLPIKK